LNKRQRIVSLRPIMRAVIQRVSEASVAVEGKVTASIGPGLLILLAVEENDEATDAEWLAPKIARMRIFPDQDGLMNVAAADSHLPAIVVSQFTLYASTRKGNRPSFMRSARPAKAVPLYESFNQLLARELGGEVQTGEFGADMKVALVNDGPVTIIVDTRERE